MKAKSTMLFLGLGSLLLFTLSCSLFASPPMEPVPITPMASPTPVVVVEEPSSAEEILPSVNLPNGVVTAKDGTLTLFDFEGYTLLQVKPPYVNPEELHIAEKIPDGGTNLPLIYYSFEQNNSILSYSYGQTITLKSVPYFAGMVGARSQPVIAYTTAEFGDDALISNLYLGSPGTLPTGEPVLSDFDPQGWALRVVAIDMDGDQPVGVWYTKQPWGIGGDIVFQPGRTLSYLDLNSRAAYQYLGAEANPSVLSADRKWVAYTNDSSVEAGGGAMALRNFETGNNISFPLLEAVDQRGAGEASFSPSNQYLAWMEANGWQMSETPNFHSLVRVGNLNGNVVAQFADTAFLTVSGMSTIQRVEPVGWIDDNTLVVMVRGEYWDDAVLVMIDISSQSMNLLARGVFVDFTYP
mgnify:FL=1